MIVCMVVVQGTFHHLVCILLEASYIPCEVLTQLNIAPFPLTVTKSWCYMNRLTLRLAKKKSGACGLMAG
jgi:hypothetical protein